jgi:hypothetical protein
MLRISAKLVHHPVLLHPTCGNVKACQVPLVGHVFVASDRSRQIGGIKVILETSVQRRRRRRNGNPVWSTAEVIGKHEVDVIQGVIDLAIGETLQVHPHI